MRCHYPNTTPQSTFNPLFTAQPPNLNFSIPSFDIPSNHNLSISPFQLRPSTFSSRLSRVDLSTSRPRGFSFYLMTFKPQPFNFQLQISHLPSSTSIPDFQPSTFFPQRLYTLPSTTPTVIHKSTSHVNLSTSRSSSCKFTYCFHSSSFYMRWCRCRVAFCHQILY